MFHILSHHVSRTIKAISVTCPYKPWGYQVTNQINTFTVHLWVSNLSMILVDFKMRLVRIHIFAGLLGPFMWMCCFSSCSYQFEEIYFHWGSGDDSSNSGLPGSEHSIDGYFFPAEIQIFGFNSILFKNVSEALKHPHGVVAISVMVQESERTIRNGFGPITNHLKKVGTSRTSQSRKTVSQLVSLSEWKAWWALIVIESKRLNECLSISNRMINTSLFLFLSSLLEYSSYFSWIIDPLQCALRQS